jgi:hypothetical protein
MSLLTRVEQQTAPVERIRVATYSTLDPQDQAAATELPPPDWEASP